MHKLLIGAAAATVILGGCASLPSPQLTECLQPNRRVAVEVGGTAPRLAPNPKLAGKPGFVPVALIALVQGSTAFDFGAAVLKDGARSGLDQLLDAIAKRNVRIGSVVIIGHSDRLEAENSSANISEDRAKAVVAYLASRGIDQKLIVWEGKGAQEPMPITKFCA